jgi:hypothetical protein
MFLYLCQIYVSFTRSVKVVMDAQKLPVARNWIALNQRTPSIGQCIECEI